MTRILTPLAALAASPALAHDAHGVPHAHPHGFEALIVLLVLAVAAIAWRYFRR